MIRGLYDWIVDNELTPYILVNSDHPDAEVPQEFANNGRIVLNISPVACRGLHIENDRLIFTARFSGIVRQIFVPPPAVLAIYAKENGRGMEFPPEDEDTVLPPKKTKEAAAPVPLASRKPSLKLVTNTNLLSDPDKDPNKE